MSQENNFIPNQENYKPLTPFQLFVKSNFPFIENTFEALDNYGLYCKIVEYLNDVIENENTVEDNVTALYNAFVSLNNYVSNYFDNLDVQEEINNKLDEMAESGELQDVLHVYFEDLENSYNQRFTEQASAIQQQNNAINSLDSRMDTFTQLTQGSTSGDAELQDIRISSNGYTYTTAGDSVRNQITNIHKNIGDYIYNITTKGETGGYVEIEQNVQSGTEFYVKLNDYKGINLNNFVIYGYNSNNQYVNLLQKNDEKVYYIKTNQDFSKIRLYVNYSLSGNLSNVYVTFMFRICNR